MRIRKLCPGIWHPGTIWGPRLVPLNCGLRALRNRHVGNFDWWTAALTIWFELNVWVSYQRMVRLSEMTTENAELCGGNDCLISCMNIKCDVHGVMYAALWFIRSYSIVYWQRALRAWLSGPSGVASGTAGPDKSALHSTQHDLIHHFCQEFPHVCPWYMGDKSAIRSPYRAHYHPPTRTEYGIGPLNIKLLPRPNWFYITGPNGHILHANSVSVGSKGCGACFDFAAKWNISMK